MATNTVKAPGGGIVVDDQSGDTVIIPGVGIFAKRAAAATFVPFPAPRGLQGGMLKMTGGMQ